MDEPAECIGDNSRMQIDECVGTRTECASETQPNPGYLDGDHHQRDTVSSSSSILDCTSASQHHRSHGHALFSSIPDDTFCAVLEFVGTLQYRYIGGVNRRFRHTYQKSPDGYTNIASTSTSTNQGLDSPLRAKILLEDEGLNPCTHGRLVAEDACLLAAKSGRLTTLRYLRQRGCEWSSSICMHAAFNGHFEVLQWARNNGCPWNKWTCESAAQNGHLEVLQWARNNGCPWDEETCARAALNGHLEVLQWARNNGCPWNQWTCESAALNGHLEVLQWARNNGCPWNEWTCWYAAENGHLEVLQWATNNGCPWDLNTRERVRYLFPNEEFEAAGAN